MNEINEIVTKMNAIQGKAFDGTLTRADKADFKTLWRAGVALGYTFHKKSQYGSTPWGTRRRIGVLWYVTEGQTEKRSRNTECEWIKTDVRPQDGYRTLKGDCTTRAMSFCLEGILSYREIERQQYILAAQKHTRRNTCGTWDIVICKQGWMKVNLMRGIKRSQLACVLKGHLTKPCISRSSGHVAAIDVNGCVRDTWDSRGGKVTSLWVFGDDYGAVDNALGRYGIQCQPVLNPKEWAA